MKRKKDLRTELALLYRVSPFAGGSAGSDEDGGIPWWAWVPGIFALTVVVVLLWLRRQKYQPELPPYSYEIHPQRPEPAKPRPSTAPARPVVPAKEAKPIPEKRDDLKRIAGIGPKIASTFQAAGIHIYAELAATDVSRLEEILKEAGIRLADPGTWPEQAALAAAGDWEGLKAMQERLKGGRRV